MYRAADLGRFYADLHIRCLKEKGIPHENEEFSSWADPVRWGYLKKKDYEDMIAAYQQRWYDIYSAMTAAAVGNFIRWLVDTEVISVNLDDLPVVVYRPLPSLTLPPLRAGGITRGKSFIANT